MSNLGSSLPGFSGSNFVDFYIDTDGNIVESTDTSIATMTTNSQKTHLRSAITTPNGDTLDNYSILSAYVEVYAPEGGFDWHSPGQFDTNQGGTTAGTLIGFFEDRIYFSTSGAYYNVPINTGQSKPTNSGFTTSPKMIRARIVAVRI